MRRATFIAIALAPAMAVMATAASATDARTTRIEPRPFYGATVTLEAGVRVFRPLPPHKNVIINPGNKTPLNLTIKDVNERRHIKAEHNHNYYDRGGRALQPTYGGYYGGGAHYGRHRGRRGGIRPGPGGYFGPRTSRRGGHRGHSGGHSGGKAR